MLKPTHRLLFLFGTYQLWSKLGCEIMKYALGHVKINTSYSIFLYTNTMMLFFKLDLYWHVSRWYIYIFFFFRYKRQVSLFTLYYIRGRLQLIEDSANYGRYCDSLNHNRPYAHSYLRFQNYLYLQQLFPLPDRQNGSILILLPRARATEMDKYCNNFSLI